MWRRKLQVSQEMAQKFRTELALLKQLKDAEKADLPAAVHIQDRGHMTFMNPTLLPFIRNTVAEIRKQLNYQEYSKYGKDFFKVLHVLNYLGIYEPHFGRLVNFLLATIKIEYGL